jgi:hypothetical protein
MAVRIMLAGMMAVGEDEKKATPLGSERTPAPMILFARLNVEAAMVALPPNFGFTSLLAVAAAFRLTSLFLPRVNAFPLVLRVSCFEEDLEGNASTWQAKVAQSSTAAKNLMVESAQLLLVLSVLHRYRLPRPKATVRSIKELDPLFSTTELKNNLKPLQILFFLVKDLAICVRVLGCNAFIRILHLYIIGTRNHSKLCIMH